MKKIGIMTLHYIPNYGAVLQSYALEKYLTDNYSETMQNEFELIDYRLGERERLYSKRAAYEYFKNNVSFKGIFILMKILLRHGYLFKLREKCSEFIVLETNISKFKYLEMETIDFQDYEAVIVGSDQVWNPFLCIDLSYLLKCYDGKKYSYASSIGLPSLPEQFKEIYACQLSRFRKISLREVSGVNIVSEILPNCCIKNVIDPTLLLGYDKWGYLADKSRLKKDKPYILVYVVKESESLIDFSEAARERTGLEVVYITLPNLSRNKRLRKLGARCDYSVYDWLYLLKNCRMVVTNSFHGVAFSVNFSKEFYVEPINKNMKASTRIMDFLELLELKGRVINENNNVDDGDTIDYDSVKQLLEIERQKARKYIDEVIEDIFTE